MDIRSYFIPLNASLYTDQNRWETTQVGRNIDVYTEKHFPDIDSAKIAIFNIPEYEGSDNSSSVDDCNVRSFLYSFHSDAPPSIVDLGVLHLMPERKQSFEMIQTVCEILLGKGVVPFIIGGGHDISYAVYKAYSALGKFITLTAVDSKFDVGLEDDNLSSSSHLGKMIAHKPSSLFHYTNMGYQSYFVSNLANEMLDAMHFETIRLGDLKANFYEVEPIMRNSDFLSFDISSIQHSYASANVYSSPNGLTGAEACRIMRYAGVSDKITAVGLFEYNQNLDVNGQTAYLLAQMLWYFIEGYKIRKDELNPNLQSCSKYTVAFEDGKNQIVFYKSNTSGRWWMGVPFSQEGDEELKNFYVACSYRDYERANKGEIPQRWINTLNKFR